MLQSVDNVLYTDKGGVRVDFKSEWVFAEPSEIRVQPNHPFFSFVKEGAISLKNHKLFTWNFPVYGLLNRF